MLEELTHTYIREFEHWRDRQMLKKPKTSTLNNFTSTWNKNIATAVERGFISELEINRLLVFMETWAQQGRLAVKREMRPLLRDYVEMLLLTGMRHGTEALGICWRHLEWHTDKGVRYLRVWVDGKTCGRWLIAKHRAVEVLKRHIQKVDA